MSDAPAPRLSVLVADDQAAIRMILEMAISRHGHSVALAEDGEALLLKAQQRSFDLCIMDAAMPGPSLAQRLTALHKCSPSTVVAVLSGYAIPAEALKDSAVRFIAKPLDLGVLDQLLVDVVADRLFEGTLSP